MMGEGPEIGQTPAGPFDLTSRTIHLSSIFRSKSHRRLVEAFCYARDPHDDDSPREREQPTRSLVPRRFSGSALS
jgi:hypothetical protein